MKNDFKHSIILLTVVFAIMSCHSESGNVADTYNAYQFDSAIIEKLPLYDSLAKTIVTNISLFKLNTEEGDDTHAFRYMPGETNFNEFSELPASIEPQLSKILQTIGPNGIQGFDVYKDSSIKMFVRTTTLNTIITTEILSYFPAGNVKRRELPFKDSLLNEHWLYWVRFDKEGMF